MSAQFCAAAGDEEPHEVEELDVPLTVERGEGLSVICLEGAVDIGSAAELKELLVDALAPERELRVDLERLTRLDVTWVQLLHAADREARRLGVPFTISGNVPETVSVAMRAAGFEPFPSSQPGE